MATQAQIDANRRNAQRSTGPQTPAGKAAASRNAVLHGFASITTVLNHEDAQAFAEIIKHYVAEWLPRTEHEAWLIRQMADARWRLERMRRVEAALLDCWATGIAGRTPEAKMAAVIASHNQDPLKVIERYTTSAERSYYKALRELNASRESRPVPDAPALVAADPSEIAKLQNEPNPVAPEPAHLAELQNEPEPSAEPASTILQNEPNWTVSPDLPVTYRSPAGPERSATCMTK